MKRGKVSFKNLNNPQQPRKGVYCWSYVARGQSIPLYIGQAGRKDSIVIRPSTLARGLSELQRAAGLSSNKGRSLDTDFIVGTAIKYLTERGYDCIWKHLDDKPEHEKPLCHKCNPVLQNGGTRILSKFKSAWHSESPWEGRNNQDIATAEESLYRLFAETFNV